MLEDSLPTPSKMFKSVDENLSPSPLQGKVARPSDNENGSPTMINFDFDTLEQNKYFGMSELFSKITF